MISLTIFTIIILTGNHTKNNLRLITFSLCKLIIKLIIYNKKEFKFDTFALTFPCLLTLSNLLFLCEITLMIHFQVSCKTKGSSGILFVYLSYICSCVSHRERERRYANQNQQMLANQSKQTLHFWWKLDDWLPGTSF